MKKYLLTSLISVILIPGLTAQDRGTTPALRYDENHSLTWEEAIGYYTALDEAYPEASLIEMGMTDAGRPLHLFIISADGETDPEAIRRKGKAIVLIINGIHPGEPEGIDASAQFAADILANRDGIKKYLRTCAVAIVPVYNIGGALARSPYWRINQNGPEEKGARRNTRFLDLNRDFVKQDSRDARAFAGIYTWLDPDIFLDTHTTNGSDHQFTVTLIATQPEKMHPEMQEFFRVKMLPELYSRMKTAQKNEMVPYVQYTERGEIRAIIGFEEHAYYSTGYSALFNSFGFMTETLVYKPYRERVEGTRQFISELVRYTSMNHKEILRLRAEANQLTRNLNDYVLDWDQDSTRWDLIAYRGYRYEDTVTPITGRKTGFYNHDKPYTDTIRYYNYFNPSITVTAPAAYILPFAWEEVIGRLQANGVIMHQLKNDTTVMIESYYIDSYEPAKRATQGHYFNSNVKLRKVRQEVDYMKGDYLIPMKQRANKYIVTMLEPQSESGFFAWNFFDSFLEGQDWYSVWGFESHLKELLDHDPVLKAAFDKARSEDEKMAVDPVVQLQWLYQNTPASVLEKRTRLYPVGRIMP
jgi:Zinc carboxypeptidase